jgi:hypothetical protein
MKTRILTLILLITMFNIFGQKKKENNNKYLFKDNENTACFTCKHIINEKKPILYASHDSEGDWQFLCGKEGHIEGDAKIISLKSATELDQSLNDLFEMPKGVGAERKTKNDKWKPFKL